MTHCGNLEQLELRRDRTALCERVTVANLPRLRHLTLTAHIPNEHDTFDLCLSREQTVRILRAGRVRFPAHSSQFAGFSLVSLALSISHAALIDELAAVHFNTLEKLSIDIEPSERAFLQHAAWVRLITTFGKALENMAKLAHLRLGIGRLPPPPRKDQSLFALVRWTLPSLTQLHVDEVAVSDEYADSELRDCPRIDSPSLTDMYLRADNDQSLA